MGRIADLLNAGVRAAMGGGGQQKPAATAPPAAPGAGQSGPQQPLTMTALLAQLAEQRPGLEERFEADAMLFATNIRAARKVYPEAEARVAYQYLTARCDDAQFGTKVLFYQRNDAGQEEEVEGTRVQQVEEFYAQALPHSLADENVAAVRAGRKQALALPAGGHHQAASAGRPPVSAEDGGVDMEEEVLLDSTPQGQAIAARRRQARPAATTAAGGEAIN